MPAKTSGMAIAALIFGILSLIPPFGLVAVILGIVALVQISRAGDVQTGKVLAIIGIVLGCVLGFLSVPVLALVVVPRVMGASLRAKEATLRGNLYEIRTAVGHFEADCGVYPARLEDLVRDMSDAPTAGIDEEGNPWPIPNASYTGPYLSPGSGINGTGISINPFAGEGAGIDGHWTYRNGIVTPAVPVGGTTLDGMPYSDL